MYHDISHLVCYLRSRNNMCHCDTGHTHTYKRYGSLYKLSFTIVQAIVLFSIVNLFTRSLLYVGKIQNAPYVTIFLDKINDNSQHVIYVTYINCPLKKRERIVLIFRYIHSVNFIFRKKFINCIVNNERLNLKNCYHCFYVFHRIAYNADLYHIIYVFTAR